MPNKPNPKFWNFIRTSESVTDLYIYDEIAAKQSFNPQTYERGTEVTSKDFVRDLGWVDTPQIVVHINSGGGDSIEAVAIGQAIKDARAAGKKVICHVDGLCASAAVTVAMACEKIMIPANAYMMIHDPAVLLLGYFGEDDLTKLSGQLNTCKRGIIATYAERTGKDEKEISKAMAAETWMDGAAAVSEHYADELLETPATLNVVEDADNRTVNVSGAVLSCAVFNRAPDALKNLKKQSVKGETNVDIKNCDDLRTAYPELVKEVEDNARKTGAAEERERMHGLDEVASAVPAEMLNKAKYETFAGAKDVLFDAAKGGKLVNSNSVLAGMAADAVIVNQVPGVVSVPGASELTKEQKDVAAAMNFAEAAFKKMRK